METIAWGWRFLIALLLDFIDLINPIAFTPGIGTIWDALMTGAGLFLWGKYGLLEGAELLTPNALDAFIPTLTIAGLLAYARRNT